MTSRYDVEEYFTTEWMRPYFRNAMRWVNYVSPLRLDGHRGDDRRVADLFVETGLVDSTGARRSLTATLGEHRHLRIHGEPGTGRAMRLKHLAAQLLTLDQSEALKEALGGRWKLPVPVEEAELGWNGKDGWEGLFAAWREHDSAAGLG